MSEKKGRGVVDPWRTVDPVHPPKPAPPSRKRIDPDEVDHDADLAIPNTIVIRSTHTCFNVTAVGIESDADAFNRLAECVADLFGIKDIAVMLYAAGIGVRCSDRMLNVPSEDVQTSTLKAGGSGLWFTEKPLDQGVLELARIMRSPYAASTLRRYGITSMMTSS